MSAVRTVTEPAPRAALGVAVHYAAVQRHARAQSIFARIRGDEDRDGIQGPRMPVVPHRSR